MLIYCINACKQQINAKMRWSGYQYSCKFIPGLNVNM
jgi:hypothetical protein